MKSYTEERGLESESTVQPEPIPIHVLLPKPEPEQEIDSKPKVISKITIDPRGKFNCGTSRELNYNCVIA